MESVHLEINVNFADEKHLEIANEIHTVLSKFGFKEFSRESLPDDSGTYYLEKLTFYPKQSF